MPLLRPAFRAARGRGRALRPRAKPPAARSPRAIISISSTARAICSAPITLCRRFRANPTGCRPDAVSGYCNMLWKLLEDIKGGDKPTHLAVIFDAGKTHVPQRDLSAIQGEPARSAGGSDPAISAGARRDARLRRGVHRRSRASRPTICIATYARMATRSGRARHDRVVRQGSDAACRRRQGRIVRHDEEQAHRLGRSDGKIRRAAVEGGRGAGAGRRFHRQCARRARHRREDGGRTDQYIWRSRNAC